MVAVYERPMGDYVGPFALDGTVEWTNSTSVARTMSIRLMVQLSDGIIPIIPEQYSGLVCWEPSTKRIITVVSQRVEAGENIEVPVIWEIVTRLEGQLADFNGDGWVDELDQTLLDWRTRNRQSSVRSQQRWCSGHGGHGTSIPSHLRLVAGSDRGCERWG